MIIESRSALHFGVNFVLAPPPLIDGKHIRSFQDHLAEEALEFTGVNTPATGMGVFERSPTRPLQVRVQTTPPVAQLLIIAPIPERTVEEFMEEAEAVCSAFQKTWPSPVQLVARDCTIRHLYDVPAEHAFEYLWVKRLGETESQLGALGRPVLGGGLRFVMPPIASDTEPKQVEVKIESFLNNSRKLYVDVSFAWPSPVAPGSSLDPGAMLQEVQAYATTEVVAFIRGDSE